MTTMEMTQAQTTKSTQAYAILQRSVCLTLQFSYLGNNRKVDLTQLVESAGVEQGEATATVDESVFHATKRLLDPKVLRPANRVSGLVKSYMRSMSLSMHRIFGDSTYLIPVMAVEEVDRRLQEFAEQLAHEASLLAENYETAKEEQRAKLGPHFKESDYLTPDEVRESFGMDWAYVSFASPERLETVSMALAQRSNAKYEQRLNEAFAETVAALRGSALAVMKDLSMRLSPSKVLRGTALDDLLDFCQRLPMLNSIACDDDLAEAMKVVQARVSGLDVQQLRDSEEMRAELAKFAADMSVQLESMVVETRGRAISFGDIK